MVPRRTRRSSGSVAGTRSGCESERHVVAATTGSELPAWGRGEGPEGRLRIADGPVERRAWLGDQPRPADPLQVDHVVLDGDVFAIGEAMGDGGGDARAIVSQSLRLHLDDRRAPPGRAAIRRPRADRGA